MVLTHDEFRDENPLDDRVETRYCELRVDGERRISGVAIAYGDTATMPWGDKERFEPGAFGNLDSADVVLNVQHDRGRPIARTGGGGLSLRNSNDSLQISAELPETREAEDAVKLIKARILRGLSIEFLPTTERMEDNVRIVEKAELRGIGVVDKPAYKMSRVAARSDKMSNDTPTNDAMQTAIEAAIAKVRAESQSEVLDAQAQTRAISEAVMTAVAAATESLRGEADELRGKMKKMADDEEAMKKKEEEMKSEMESEIESRAKAAEEAAQARADLIVQVRSLVPAETDFTGLSAHEIRVLAVGDEVEGAQERSDDYLDAKIEGIIERRERAAEQTAAGEHRHGEAAGVGGVNVIRMIEQRAAKAA